jgi:hypothetical protein
MSMKKAEDSLVTFESSESVIIRSLFEVLKDMLVESNLVFTKEGIELRSTAQGHYTHLFLSADKIDSYYCEKDLVIGVNFTEFHNAVKSLTQDDTVGIQITQEGFEAGEIDIFILNQEIGWSQKRSCAILYMEEDFREPPVHTFNMSVSIPSVLFQRLVRCHRTGKTVQILAHRGIRQSFVYFYTPSTTRSDLTKLICELSRPINNKTNNKQLLCKTSEKSADKKDFYALKTLQTISKSAGMSKKIRLFLNPDYPLVVRCDVGSLGQLTFVLAPIWDDDVNTLSLPDILREDPDVISDAKLKDTLFGDADGKDNEDSVEEDEPPVSSEPKKKKLKPPKKRMKRKKKPEPESDDDDDDESVSDAGVVKMQKTTLKKKRRLKKGAAAEDVVENVTWKNKNVPKQPEAAPRSKNKDEMMRKLERQMAKEFEQEELLERMQEINNEETW